MAFEPAMPCPLVLALVRLQHARSVMYVETNKKLSTGYYRQWRPSMLGVRDRRIAAKVRAQATVRERSLEREGKNGGKARRNRDE